MRTDAAEPAHPGDEAAPREGGAEGQRHRTRHHRGRSERGTEASLKARARRLERRVAEALEADPVAAEAKRAERALQSRLRHIGIH